jgi:hypothetical protein
MKSEPRSCRSVVERSPPQGWPASNRNGRDQIGIGGRLHSGISGRLAPESASVPPYRLESRSVSPRPARSFGLSDYRELDALETGLYSDFAIQIAAIVKVAVSAERGSKTSGEAKELRKTAGSWLKDQRRAANISQMELANKLGFKYYTFISQVENGFGRVPSESMEKWARALNIQPGLFARKLLAYYEPHLHRLLFEENSHDDR